MLQNLMLFLLIFFSGTLSRGSETHSLDQGQELYQALVRKSADDRWSVIAEVLKNLQNIDPQQDASAWIQNYLFLLDTVPDKVAPHLKNPETFIRLLQYAEQKRLGSLILPLEYHQQISQLNSEMTAAAETLKFQTIFIEKAIKEDNIRFAVRLLNESSYQAYNEGSMQRAFQLSKKAFALLENRVNPNDIQMLELKGKMALYLENEQERKKAEEIYDELIKVYEQANLRTALGDIYFNYALLLTHNQDFSGGEKYYKKVSRLGESLNADLYRGQGLRGLGYVQFQQGKFKEAVESYSKAVKYMIAAEDDPVSIADTYKLIGSTYNELENYEKALENFDIAEKSQAAMQDKVWQNNLLQSRLDAYIGLGRIKDALKLSININGLLIEYMLKTREEETNKVKVSMGLQLEEQKSKMLAEQNQLQQEKLRDSEILRQFFYGLLLLAAAVILLLAVVLRQTQKAKQSRERMHRILEHIDEGILSIGQGMKVEADLSPYLARLLDISGHLDQTKDMFAHLLDASNLKADEQATLRAALQACLGEESLSWDLNFGQLPVEISIQNGQKQISLDWQPLYADDRRIHNVLVTVRDITSRKKMQTEIELAQSRATHMQQRILDILKVDARRIETFIRETKSILPLIRPRLERLTELSVAYGHLHTLKGMARSLGFKEISTLAHELEDHIDIQQNTLKTSELAFHLLDEIEFVVQEYADIVDRIFQREGQTVLRTAETLLDLATELLAPVRTSFQESGFEKPYIDIQDHVRSWPQPWLDTVRLALLHGLTNSVDHGFVLPIKRGEILDRSPSLEILAQESASGLTLELRDNGIGLNKSRLKILAEKIGYPNQTDDSLGNVIFMEGISTADSVSKTSGRGIGMSAVKHAVDALNGEVQFRTNPTGPGSSLLIHIPVVPSASRVGDLSS